VSCLRRTLLRGFWFVCLFVWLVGGLYGCLLFRGRGMTWAEHVGLNRMGNENCMEIVRENSEGSRQF